MTYAVQSVNLRTYYGNAGTEVFSFPLLLLLRKHEPWECRSNFRTMRNHPLVKLTLSQAA